MSSQPPVRYTTTEVTVGGRYSVTVPDGWKYAADGGGGVEFTQGANRLSASSIEVPPSTQAVEDVVVLVRSHRDGFTGKFDDPADRSTQTSSGPVSPEPDGSTARSRVCWPSSGSMTPGPDCWSRAS